MSRVELSLNIEEEETSKGYLKFDNNKQILAFECHERDLPDLNTFSKYLELVKANQAYLFMVMPESLDDFFYPDYEKNVFKLPAERYYRSFMLVAAEMLAIIGEKLSPDNFEEYKKISYFSFPAAPFLCGRADLSEFLYSLEDIFPGRTRLLDGDRVHEIFQGRLDETGNYYLRDNPTERQKKYGILKLSDEQWIEEMYPDSIGLRELMKLNWLSDEYETFSNIWELADRLRPVSKKQMKLF